MELKKYVVLSGSKLEKLRDKIPKLYSYARIGCKLRTPVFSKPKFIILDSDTSLDVVSSLGIHLPTGVYIELNDLNLSFSDFNGIFVDENLFEDEIKGHKFQWELKELINKNIELEVEKQMCMYMHGVESQQFKDAIKRAKPVKHEMLRIISTIGAVK